MTPEHTVCAEYLALRIAGRTQASTWADRDRIADIVGLSPDVVDRLLRAPTMADVTGRRAALDAYTAGGAR